MDTNGTVNFAVFSKVDTICTMHYAVFLEGGYYLHYALRRIFRGWILSVLRTTHYFQGVDTIGTVNFAVFSKVDTICTMHYAVFSGGGYYLYYALRSIFGGWILFVVCTSHSFWGWILFVLCTLQYFQRVNIVCTMHYAVFSGGGYYLYYALCSIFRGRILFVLFITQYF